MSQWKFGKRSNMMMEEIPEKFRSCITQALSISPVDFGVIESARHVERQMQMVAIGASQTMNSKHIPDMWDGEDRKYAHAVDLMAYIGSRGSWELPLYFKIATSMAQAAQDHDLKLRWGGAWTTNSIGDWHPRSMEDAHLQYIEIRKSQGRKWFIDAPHFEMMTA